MTGSKASRVHLTSTVAMSQSQVATHVEGEVVILGLHSGEYYDLDAVGARIWDLLQEPRTVQALLEVLLQEYDVDSERCERDLLAVLQELADEGLIEVNNEAPP